MLDIKGIAIEGKILTKDIIALIVFSSYLLLTNDVSFIIEQ